ncbi:MAG TPA: O-antigen ligase family protein [Rugosimonospora sp.]|nr:O-antigen ligase family protein [Rugosimonospora sp.]
MINLTRLPHPRRWAVGIGAAVAVLAGVLDLVSTGNAGEAVKALVAGAIAVSVLGLAVSLPGVTPRGAVIGGLFVAAGIFTWTFTDRPAVIWAVLGVQGVLFAIWGRPWLARLRDLPRLGGAWLGLAYWLLGIIGAVLVGHAGVAVQRVAYAGVFTLAVMAVVTVARGPAGRRDITVSIAAAMLVGVAVLLLLGAGNVFDAVHAAPAGASAQAMRNRFWGGLDLFYHPNSMAGLAVGAAIRIGPDRAFAAWQRLAATLVAGFLLFLSDSRIGLVFAAAAALLHGVLLLRRRYEDLPRYRRPVLAAAVPFVVLGLVLALSGTESFFFASRFTTPAGSSPDVTSGRIDTWRQVAQDWKHAGWAEKLFGDARTSRAVVVRTNDGAPPGTPHAKLNTDNAAVGALRRGGVFGVVAFLIGLVLLLRHALRRRAGPGAVPAWFVVAALAMVPTIATEDWMLGGTNGALWLLLLAGEAGVAWAADRRDEPVATDTPALARSRP